MPSEYETWFADNDVLQDWPTSQTGSVLTQGLSACGAEIRTCQGTISTKPLERAYACMQQPERCQQISACWLDWSAGFPEVSRERFGTNNTAY